MSTHYVKWGREKIGGIEEKKKKKKNLDFNRNTLRKSWSEV